MIKSTGGGFTYTIVKLKIFKRKYIFEPFLFAVKALSVKPLLNDLLLERTGTVSLIHKCRVLPEDC